MAEPIYKANLPYGPGVPYCSDNETMVCPLMRQHKDEDLTKCDNCENYPYKKPIYTHEEWKIGAAKNLQRRMGDILDHLEDILPEERKNEIAKKIAEEIIVEKIYIKPEKTKKIIWKKKPYKKINIISESRRIHSVGPLNLTDSDKRYCLSCLYLPPNCLCRVKTDGKITEIHITNEACSEYKEKVF